MDAIRRAVVGVLALVLAGGSPAVLLGQETPLHVPLTIDDQAILPGEQFAPVVLTQDSGGSADGPLTWRVTGNTDLRVDLTDDVVTVTPPDAAWRGFETLRFEACAQDGRCAAQDAVFWMMDDLRVPLILTYISNSGFLIDVGGKRILVDALFDTPDFPPPDVVATMRAFQPPFDAVDVILVTHNDPEHFSAEMVTRYLGAHPGTVLLADPFSARQVSARLLQVVEVALAPGERRQVIVNGIGVESLYLTPGDDELPHLGYLITVGGWRLFHPGDIVDPDKVLEALYGYRLPDMHIDFAFVPYAYLIDPDSHALVVDGIGADTVVAGQYGSISPAALAEVIGNVFPGAVTFNSELGSWTPPEPDEEEEEE